MMVKTSLPGETELVPHTLSSMCWGVKCIIMTNIGDVDAAGPVTKHRRGFFSEPTAKEVKKAQQDAVKEVKKAQKDAESGKSDHSQDGEKSIRHEGQPDDDHAKTEGVFRNVIHELKDRQLPVEMHYAHTDDVYWIPVVRIPAKGTDAI